jgi:thymidine kinase
MTEGALRLGQVADRIVMLDVVCNQCSRRGCLSTSRLVREHGPGMTMPALLSFLTADCERQRGGSFYMQCGAHFPQLPAVFGGQSGEARAK